MRHLHAKAPIHAPTALVMIAPLVLAIAGCSGATLPPTFLSAGSGASEDGAAARQPARTTEPPARTAGPAGGPAAALAEARSLRLSGHKDRALGRLDAAAASAPGDIALTRERGLLALELGQLDKAEKLLRQGIDPDQPDWRLHSALGSALSAKGRQSEAQIELAQALRLAPDQPAVLNNLAISYALDGKTREAEDLLRRITTKRDESESRQRARQNLALLLGLSGRVDEAQAVSAAALPPEQVKANVAFFKAQAANDTTVSSAGSAATSGAAVKAASAGSSLPEPVYRLGGPRR